MREGWLIDSTNILMVTRVSYRIFCLGGGESIGVSMKHGNVRGGGWGNPPPWRPAPRNLLRIWPP